MSPYHVYKPLPSIATPNSPFTRMAREFRYRPLKMPHNRS